MDKATYDAIRAAQSGDAAALEALTKENTPLIHSIVRRFYGRGTDEEDLFQIGAIGFIKAVRAFDTARGLALSTYAVPMIMGEVRRHLRDNTMIKVSRSTKELAGRAAAAAGTLLEKTGREASLSAIAAELAAPEEDVAAALSAVQTPDSLERPICDGDGLLMDILGSDEDVAEKATNRAALLALLNSGDPTEKEVLLCRFFKDRTQSETAAALGISQVQVSRMEKRALKRLRALLGTDTREKD